MTEMEMDIAGEIMAWAFDRYKGIEDLSHETMVNTYWEEKLGVSSIDQHSYDGMEIVF